MKPKTTKKPMKKNVKPPVVPPAPPPSPPKDNIDGVIFHIWSAAFLVIIVVLVGFLGWHR